MLTLILIAVLLYVFFHRFGVASIRRWGRGAYFCTWSGVSSGFAEQYEVPETIEAVCKIVKEANEGGRKVRVIGAGHSFNCGIQTRDVLISLDRLSRIVEVDKRQMLVRVEAGIRVKHLCEQLESQGLALEALGSIGEQSVGGVISTATHGTGIKWGNLSSLVRGLSLVDGTGKLHSNVTSGALLKAASVSFGVMGVLVEVTLAVVPTYRLTLVEEPMLFSSCVEQLPSLLQRNDHVKLWWMPGTENCQVYTMNKEDQEQESKKKNADTYMRQWWIEHMLLRVFDVALFLVDLFPGRIQRTLTELVFHAAFRKKTRTDCWYRIFNVLGGVPIVHHELEYAVPLEQAQEVLRKIDELIRTRQHNDIKLIQEFRFVGKDDNWLSPEYNTDTLRVTATLYGKDADNAFFNDLERIVFVPNTKARPHWGKYFRLNANQLKQRFEKWEQFCALRKDMDPNGTFLNDFCRGIFE